MRAECLMNCEISTRCETSTRCDLWMRCEPSIGREFSKSCSTGIICSSALLFAVLSIAEGWCVPSPIETVIGRFNPTKIRSAVLTEARPPLVTPVLPCTESSLVGRGFFCVAPGVAEQVSGVRSSVDTVDVERVTVVEIVEGVEIDDLFGSQGRCFSLNCPHNLRRV